MDDFEGAQRVQRVLAALDAGADVNAVEGRDDFTPLHVAARERDELLVAAGAKTETVDLNGRQATHFTQDVRVLKLLVEHGAHVNNVESGNGLTLLQVACNEGDLERVKFLFEHGAKTDSVSTFGMTALGEAKRHKHDAVAAYLEAHGVKE